MEDIRQYGEADQLAVIPISFETEYVTRKVDGIEKQVPRDQVVLGKIGDAQYRQHYWIDRLINPDRCDNPAIWQAIRPAYENWKKGEDDIPDGTPLAAVAFVPRRVVEQYRMFNVRTVEVLAKVEDGDLPKLGMDARKFRDMARKYVETASSETTKLAARAQAQDETIADLKAQLEEMRQALASKPKTEKKAA